MQLTREQVYGFARGAGFPPETARKMVAIAQRESSFRTDVVGEVNKAKETSYGLWQINWKDAGIRALLIRNGITQPEMLFDPATNARAAFLLWGGNDANLNVAWYTERVGLSYQQGEKYRANLAALPPVSYFEGVASPDPLPVISVGLPSVPPGSMVSRTPVADDPAPEIPLVAVAAMAIVGGLVIFFLS